MTRPMARDAGPFNPPRGIYGLHELPVAWDRQAQGSSENRWGETAA